MSAENGATIGRAYEPKTASELPVAFGESHKPFAAGLIDAETRGQGHPMAEYVSQHWDVGAGQAHGVLFLPPVDDKPISAIVIEEDGMFRLEPYYIGERAGLVGIDIEYNDQREPDVELVMTSEITLGEVVLKSESDFRGLGYMGAGGFAMFGTSWQTSEEMEIREVYIPQEHVGSLEVSIVKNAISSE